ncbi:DUF354 domain-containing protein [Tardisphaera saccharovorans]
MAKIHVDILTPKYALFMKNVLERLKQNHDLMITARDYSELNELLGRVGINAKVVGRHAESKEDKLRESLNRSLELEGLYKGVDLAFAQASPETARVAFGLGVPYYLVHDSPHAEAQSRLTVPLATAVLTPFPVYARHWRKYGARQVIKYRSLDPMAWIGWASKLPNPVNAGKGGKGLVVIREEEYKASYLEGKRTNLQSLAVDLARLGYDVVYAPRYNAEIDLPGVITVRSHPIMTPLLKSADAFIGAGGTMNAEAALLGTPTYSLYPGEPTDVESYLIRRGLVKRMPIGELIRHFERTSIKEEKLAFERQAEKFRKSLTDPTDFLVGFIERALNAPT